MYDERYLQQVQLLLRCLPAIRDNAFFALKGGTAINLFINDLPRLSVDIDLTYFKIEERQASIDNIQKGLEGISAKIQKMIPGVVIKEQRSKKENFLLKLLVFNNNCNIKIEPNFIMRGTLFDLERGDLCGRVVEEFKVSLKDVPMLSTAELYAGKICAALSRQHPRDLFDIKLLMETIGISEEMRSAFVVYLACNPRPIHELLKPNILNIASIFESDFINMTEEKVTLKSLTSTRKKLVDHINETLTIQERNFLISVKMGEPDYELMPFDSLCHMPALKWKVMNIKNMEKNKHKKMIDKLKEVLSL